jgi:hypothetical protein
MTLTNEQKLKVRQRHNLATDSDSMNYIADFKVFKYKEGVVFNDAYLHCDYIVDNMDHETQMIMSLRSPLEIITIGVDLLKDDDNVWIEWTGE